MKLDVARAWLNWPRLKEVQMKGKSDSRLPTATHILRKHNGLQIHVSHPSPGSHRPSAIPDLHLLVRYHSLTSGVKALVYVFFCLVLIHLEKSLLRHLEPMLDVLASTRGACLCLRRRPHLVVFFLLKRMALQQTIYFH